MRAQLPDTDIWLADLTIDDAGIRIGTPVNATRRPGYDNQPCFLPSGGAFLYSAGDSTGTDVYRREADGTIVRLTRTPESEYSPTPLPLGMDGFCAVRVEADSTQRLWRFDSDGGNPRLVLADVDSVGYFEWIDRATLALFIVGDPHTLRIVDVASQRETIVARDIGRFIRCVPGTSHLVYTVHNPDDSWRFILLPPGEDPRPLLDGVGTGQDAAWARDVLFTSSGAAVYAARVLAGGSWEPVLDAAGAGIASITRMAVRADRARIALVCVSE
ncbi:MAG TPA: hypothetical protein VFX92_06030 [Candidatus Krumholzibacteria bacterium]|nr:hypothetical protein [Candidatus Krumholzibacteria bacterium]